MSCSVILPNLINFFNNEKLNQNEEQVEENDNMEINSNSNNTATTATANTNSNNNNNNNNNNNTVTVNTKNLLNNILIQSKYTLNPKLKLKETLYHYEINAIIPSNFKKNDIKIVIKNNRLIIFSNNLNNSNNSINNNSNSNKEKYQKTINIGGKNLDYSTIKANFNNNDNTLTIKILKQVIDNEKEINVNIE